MNTLASLLSLESKKKITYTLLKTTYPALPTSLIGSSYTKIVQKNKKLYIKNKDTRFLKIIIVCQSTKYYNVRCFARIYSLFIYEYLLNYYLIE